MNARPPPDRRGREGYVSLLAMSFAVGLAVFGTALAVALREYLAASAVEQRDILDRITLESAVNATLGRLTAGESHSIKPTELADVELNRRLVSVELSLPEGKYDLQGDPDRVLLEALRCHGLIAPDERDRAPSAFATIEEMSRGWRLSAAREDCLRRVVTVGRAPETFRPEAAPGDGEGLARSAVAGDQVDVRAALAAPPGVTALWVRARLTGDLARPWMLHDYRPLRLAQGSSGCAAD